MSKKSKTIVPTFDQMLIPVIQALKALGGSANIEELDAKAIEIMNLSDQICNIPHNDKSTSSEVSYRMSWARTYLKKYGLINNSSRAVWSFI
jgi:restriction system protein